VTVEISKRVEFVAFVRSRPRAVGGMVTFARPHSVFMDSLEKAFAVWQNLLAIGEMPLAIIDWGREPPKMWVSSFYDDADRERGKPLGWGVLNNCRAMSNRFSKFFEVVSRDAYVSWFMKNWEIKPTRLLLEYKGER